MATKTKQDEEQVPEGVTPEPTDAAAAKAAKDDGAKTVPAAERTNAADSVPTKGGFMDQFSTRSDADALEGHAVSVDLNNKDVQKAYKEVGLEGHTGDYGVYIQPVKLDDKTGIPEIASVRLRDETHALISVPYEALRPAAHRGR